ncbi:hypothetical protein TNCV_4065631 [Trichonephila clavipes]|uniref:Uncharacterized protein n=1 Tax=Trichonephila clavipes TaxID=2585209 RepID=A0A8X6W983_TRICX|nr:hypothetical protein TNCV_4065631 [Trichonephila clavipes]
MFDSSSYDNPTPLAHADTSRDVLPREGISQCGLTFLVGRLFGACLEDGLLPLDGSRRISRRADCPRCCKCHRTVRAYTERAANMPVS